MSPATPDQANASRPNPGRPKVSRGKRRLESTFPPLLFLLGLIALGYGLFRYSGAARVVVALYLLWVLLELKVTFRGNPGETGGDDGGSMPLYGTARGIVVATALFVPPVWSAWSAAQSLALTVFLGGVTLRLTAIYQLGRFYSHRVRTLSDHEIVQTGPYRLIRHPAYAGMIIAHLGFTAIFLNVASVVALLALLIPAIVHRIRVEERTLMSLSGYSSYARDRKRLIPAVW